MERKVGRPIEKQNRVKIGLSLDGNYNDMLKELSLKTGKSKSRLVEEAILIIYDLEHKNNKLASIKPSTMDNPFDSLREMFNAKYN